MTCFNYLKYASSPRIWRIVLRDFFFFASHPITIYKGDKILRDLESKDSVRTDFHQHIPLDDNVDEVFRTLVELGVEETAFTYHSSFLKSHPDPFDELRRNKNILDKGSFLEYIVANSSVKIFRGQEVDAKDGHIIVFGYNKSLKNLSEYNLEDLVHLIHQNDGFVVMPHALFRRGFGEKLSSLEGIEKFVNHCADLGIDGFEISLAIPSVFGLVENSLLAYFVHKYNLSHAGNKDIKLYFNSDAHTLKYFADVWKLFNLKSKKLKSSSVFPFRHET